MQSIILSCPKELPPLSKNTDTSEGQKAFKNKQAECQNAEHLMNKITLLTNKLFKLNDQIFQNIEVLEQYKQFPLELYDWIHASDRYIAEISGVLNSFFGYLNYWMDINAKRFSQYIDVFVTILAVIKSYQVIIDFSTNWTSKCSNCTKDTYDQYACKLSFLCDGIPLDPLPIPNIKIPNLLIDLSHIDLGLDIVLPHFTFVPESIHLPRLPNLPLPPNLGLSLDFNFDIGDIPILPAPPTLPDLPSFLPHVKMQLPILPPAPKIPALPDKLSSILKIAEDLGKILCIIKSGI
ncbi:MAG: hypothetical protein Q4B28_03895 [bacterium]|nr:hypothetical protein [bacterium]